MPPPPPRPFDDLAEIGRVLATSAHLQSALDEALEILQRRLGATLVTVALREGEETAVVSSVGAHWQTARRARYRDGEGITGRVVASGRLVIVPQVSRESLFLDRTGVAAAQSGELSYLCAPIPGEGGTVGALGCALPWRRDRAYEEDGACLGVVAAMVGQAIRAHRAVERERERLVAENTKLKRELRERYHPRNLVGSSRPMQQVYEQIGQVASSSTTVLLRGESGTGKELVAQALHYSSPRADGPLVAVSCAALPEGLVEAELFGHEAGAFTGARAARKGRFELADGGTLFLDEVGELTAAMQVKLLRVLQERSFERLGGTQPVRVNVRLVAATNKDLEAALREGAFREDLYYRLNVFSIFVPPLRERRSDIPVLADHFVARYAAAHGRDVRRIATTAIDMLMSYHWPGNVRELENCVERAVLVCEGGVIHAHHLPPTLQTAEVSGTVPRLSLEASVANYEKDLILDALKSARGNRAKAARLLDSTERIVGYKVRQYAIDPRRFR